MKNLIFIPLITFSISLFAQQHVLYRIKNYYSQEYLNIESGELGCGQILSGWQSAMWVLEAVEGENLYHIKNYWKGTYLNTETTLQCGNILPGWQSAIWEGIDARWFRNDGNMDQENTIYLQNNWRKCKLAINDKKVYACDLNNRYGCGFDKWVLERIDSPKRSDTNNNNSNNTSSNNDDNLQTINSPTIRLIGSVNLQEIKTASVTLPKGAIFVKCMGMMQNGPRNECSCQFNWPYNQDFGGCNESGTDCAIAFANMSHHKQNGCTISADFKNWSDCCVRYAYLKVWYKMGDGGCNGSNSGGGTTTGNGIITFVNKTNQSLFFYYVFVANGANYDWCQYRIPGGEIHIGETVSKTIPPNQMMSYKFYTKTICDTEYIKNEGTIASYQANGDIISVGP